MRGVIAALVVAAAIVSASCVYTNKMNRISEELTEINESVTEKVRNEDYAAAVESIEKLRRKVDENRTLLTATCNHTRVDEIEKGVSELAGFVSEGQKAEAYARSCSLGVLIRKLPRDNRMSLENIL